MRADLSIRATDTGNVQGLSCGKLELQEPWGATLGLQGV